MHLKKNHITCTELLAIFASEQTCVVNKVDYPQIFAELNHSWIIPGSSLYNPSIIPRLSQDIPWIIPGVSLNYP